MEGGVCNSVSTQHAHFWGVVLTEGFHYLEPLWRLEFAVLCLPNVCIFGSCPDSWISLLGASLKVGICTSLSTQHEHVLELSELMDFTTWELPWRMEFAALRLPCVYPTSALSGVVRGEGFHYLEPLRRIEFAALCLPNMRMLASCPDDRCHYLQPLCRAEFAALLHVLHIERASGTPTKILGSTPSRCSISEFHQTIRVQFQKRLHKGFTPKSLGGVSSDLRSQRRSNRNP